MSKSAKKLIPGNCCCFFCGSYVFKTNIPETDSLKAPEKSCHVLFSIVNSRQGGQIFVPGGVIITHLSEGGAEKHPKLTVRTWKSKVGWKTIRLRFGAEIWPIFRNELAVSFGFWVWIWCVSRFYPGKFCPFSKNHYFGEFVSYNSFQSIKLAGSDLEYVIRRFSVWWRWCLRPWRACCLLTNGRGQCEQQVGQTELEDVILWKTVHRRQEATLQTEWNL